MCLPHLPSPTIRLRPQGWQPCTSASCVRRTLPGSKSRPLLCRAAATQQTQSAVHLPSGLKIKTITEQDVPLLINEVLENRCYLQHGILLPLSGVVIDVGANIGLFSMQAATALGKEVKPLPPSQNLCIQGHTSASYAKTCNRAHQSGTQTCHSYLLHCC